MATKKKQPTKVNANDTRAYGTTSGPPHERVKEMAAEHAEESSKDSLHKPALKPALKPKKAK
jgi:hypothetical protein